MRLGILQCDSVHEKLRSDFDDYPDMFQKLLDEGGLRAEYRVYDLPRGRFPSRISECDSWLITGSKHSVYDPGDWIARAHELVRHLYSARRPLVAICFGHQLVARALGGQVEQAAAGWGAGVHTTRIIATRSWMQPPREELSLVVSHQDQVTVLPEGAQHLAGHDFCPYDMFQIGDHILTFQGHPEFPKEYSRALINMRVDRIGETRARESLESLAKTPDAVVAARWINRFMHQGLGKSADAAHIAGNGEGAGERAF